MRIRKFVRPPFVINLRRLLYTSSDIVKVEKKWKEKWQNEGPRYKIDESKGKKYILSMFPYPSGALHMGHVRVYTISDAISRYHRLNGYRVMHPMGWDAFGLPAENAAIERGISPVVWTGGNIRQMREQLDSLSLNFDWDREVRTCDPEYYRWTQWIFVRLFRRGLVYRKEGLVNWDPIDQTVLADEQVDINGRSWRSGAMVERRPLTQWYLKITAFQNELLDEIDKLRWPEAVKEMQRNWIIERSDNETSRRYRLRDWLISRQRYWGTPIPIIHCHLCGTVPVSEDQLPVELPKDVLFTGRGSPLQTLESWLEVKCPSCGNPKAKREADTMDTFMDSSWYFLRYCDPKNRVALANIESIKHFMPVDVYIGGIEHAILHLLYARFINRFLAQELGASIGQEEPFSRLITQGLVEGLTYRCPDTGGYLKSEEYELLGDKIVVKTTGKEAQVEWAKMSKSKHNGIDPVQLVNAYGADVLRLCILFKAPPEVSLRWNTKEIAGPQRWIVRLLNLTERALTCPTSPSETKCREFGDFLMEKAFDLNNHKLNLTVSSLMKLSNEIEKNLGYIDESLIRKGLKALAIMLHPAAPHTSSEMLSILGIDQEEPLNWPH